MSNIACNSSMSFLQRRPETITEAINRLSRVVDTMYAPRGGRNDPARSCADLAFDYPQLADGMYFIDPNQGSVKDAIRVNCKISRRETCLPMPKVCFLVLLFILLEF